MGTRPFLLINLTRPFLLIYLTRPFLLICLTRPFLLIYLTRPFLLICLYYFSDYFLFPFVLRILFFLISGAKQTKQITLSVHLLLCLRPMCSLNAHRSLEHFF